MTFPEKVQSLTASQVIDIMIKSLKNPHVRVHMGTFGSVVFGECVGCAATNMVCELAGKTFTEENIEDVYDRAEFIECDPTFLEQFESCIDFLRMGDIDLYNIYAKRIGLVLLKKPEVKPPYLQTEDYMYGLKSYEELAKIQTS